MLSLNKYVIAKKHKSLLVCAFLFFNIAFAQINLIQNPSFELYTPPLNCGGGFDNYTSFPVKHIVDNWYSFNSADYFHAIYSNTYCGVPTNIFGNSISKNGSGFVGISVYQENGSNYKEYCYQHLSYPLITGKTYCASFFTSRSDRKECAIKQLGAYFSTTLPVLISGQYINAIPQVVNQSGFLTDTIGWAEIQGCFVANGGEQYMTIGNFNSNANTDTLYISATNPIPSDPFYAYYYLDSISLWEDTNLDVNELKQQNEYFKLYPNPVNDILNVEYKFTGDNALLNIKNILGEIILCETITDKKFKLKTNNLISGIYFIELRGKGKLIGIKKIIKQ